MIPLETASDLIVLAADKSMQLAVIEILNRHQAIGIRTIVHRVILQPNYDSGVLLSAHKLLQAQSRNYLHALTICDRHGCGRETLSREQLETRIEHQLSAHWADRAAAIVVDPELENWFWADSPHVAHTIGWKSGLSNLRAWLGNEGFLEEGRPKPLRPKEALEKALRHNFVRRSSALYADLASKVSFQHCGDPAFRKLIATLQRWFPATA